MPNISIVMVSFIHTKLQVLLKHAGAYVDELPGAPYNVSPR